MAPTHLSIHKTQRARIQASLREELNLSWFFFDAPSVTEVSGTLNFPINFSSEKKRDHETESKECTYIL